MVLHFAQSLHSDLSIPTYNANLSTTRSIRLISSTEWQKIHIFARIHFKGICGFKALDNIVAAIYSGPCFWASHPHPLTSIYDQWPMTKNKSILKYIDEVMNGKKSTSYIGLPLWGGFPRKKLLFFWILSKLPPPLPAPIWTTCTTFFRSRNLRFESQFRTKNTIYTFKWYTI